MNKTTFDSKCQCCATCQYWGGRTEWQYPGLVYLDQDHDMNGSCNNTYMGANVQAIAVCSNWKPRY